MTRAKVTKKARTKRVPFGVRQLKMTADSETMGKFKSQKKVPRWINDVDNRIATAIEGGYSFVEDSGKKQVEVGGKTQDKDRRIKKIVGKDKTGIPITAYLMSIPALYYNRDCKEKEKQNVLVDQAIRGGNPAGLQAHGVPVELGETSVRRVDYKP